MSLVQVRLRLFLSFIGLLALLFSPLISAPRYPPRVRGLIFLSHTTTFRFSGPLSPVPYNHHEL